MRTELSSLRRRYSSDSEEGTPEQRQRQRRSQGADLEELLQQHFADSARTVRRFR